ncbi:MAG: hypothetical protein ISR57_01435 [Bacteroidales bacterium]|nr:hypothetical protein [Bacteroidota bacterium]MBL6949283.1 hypothetical protein [Bacteroidales bacterium]
MNIKTIQTVFSNTLLFFLLFLIPTSPLFAQNKDGAIHLPDTIPYP